MAPIPQEEIERLKREVSVQRLAEALGVELKQHGKDLLGLCPFHPDKEPSLVITPSKQLWHCLGACQAGGTCIDWVMRAERLTFRDAIKWLQRLEAPPAMLTTTTAAPPISPITPADQPLLLEVVAFYHEALKKSPDALDYLKSRGIENQAAIEHFKLGYSNRMLGKRFLADQPEKRERLTELGLLRATGHELLNGCFVVPIFDEAGQVTEMYGRKIGKAHHQGTPLHLYLPGPHHGVFNIEALKASKSIILCEALIDALTFWCAGYENVTASYGIEGFTRDHWEAFERYGTERVYLAYDRDDAGERAAAALAEKLLAKGIQCFRVQFPKSMDANDYACQVRPARKSLGIVLDKAIWMGSGPPPELTEANEADIIPLPAATAKEKTSAVEPIGSEPPPSAAPVIIPSKVPPPTASPSLAAQPPSPSRAASVDVKGDEVRIGFGDRSYRVRGFSKSASSESLKVNLLVAQGARFFVDTLDLYAAKQRMSFLRQAADELSAEMPLIKREVDQVLLELDALKAKALEETLAPQGAAPVVLSQGERDEALDLLRAPDLCARIAADFQAAGLVGETTNALVGYLACISRKLEAPLGIVIQSSSAAGKSSLMEAILAFMPKEEQMKYSAMTGQSLFYMAETGLRHKVLAIAEEEGASRATYALKLLQSEGELTIAATGKDPLSGKLVTQEYHVEGPVALMLTTTAIEIDEELTNRCLVLGVNEDREQTRAIQQRQRQAQTLDGLLLKHDRSRVIQRQQNAQRLLRALHVVNPFAERLTFLDEKTRTRRDHMKYLTLIKAIALLHQHQRPVHKVMHQGQLIEYIEVLADDVALANQFAHDVLGRSLDELPPQTRRVLDQVDAMVTEASRRLGYSRSDYRFSRRDVRERVGLTNAALKKHLDRLQDMEYLLAHRGTRGQSFVYELVYDSQGKAGERFLPGLLEMDALLDPTPQAKKFSRSRDDFSHFRRKLSPPFHPQNTPLSPPFHPHQEGSPARNGAGEVHHGGESAPKSTDTRSFKTAVVENPTDVRKRNGHSPTSPLATEPVRRVD